MSGSAIFGGDLATLGDRATPDAPRSGLRLLAFCDYFHPDAGGGAERVAYEVYRRLASWGAEVTVVTTAGEGRDWEEGSDLRVVEVPSVDLTRRIGLQASVTRGATRRARRLASELRPHVLHANSLQFQTSVAAARLQRRSGLPLVLTAHLGGFEHLPGPWRALAGAHERSVGRYLTRRAGRIIAVSEAVRTHLLLMDVPGERIRVVPNGVDHDVYHPAPLREEGAPVSLLFVGRLVPNKGPDILLEAFAELRRERLPVRLTVVGDGPMRANLEWRARSLGVATDVTFSGPSDDVAGHLRRADVFVRPTLTEGMPLAVLEAMAAGVCVVASDVPGNAWLLDQGKLGALFPAGDARGLAASLRGVVHDAERRAALAAAGHRASLGYSWDRCARETLEVLAGARALEGRAG